MDIDQEWEKFLLGGHDTSSDDEEYEIIKQTNEEFLLANLSLDLSTEAPKATPIYISTKTKIAYLNSLIDLKQVFWDIPVILYGQPSNGVIKKQIKFNSSTQEELIFIQNKLKNEVYFEEYIITNIDNPTGRIKFKDTRKISIGVSKKQLMSYRCKQKSAFYNCFVLILRIKLQDVFKEIHVKVFNTGKLEIPGVQSESTFNLILNEVVKTLQPHIKDKLCYKNDSNETVLINSNFNCGFFINREALYNILKFKYNIESIYDGCSEYPGIQSKFYYNPNVEIQTGCQISEDKKDLYSNIIKVSFMIFRTGSVLIVGRCDENILMVVYEFIKIILNNEYKNICQKNIKNSEDIEIVKKKKIRKKNIFIEINNNI